MKVIYFQVRQKYVYKSLIYIDLRTRFHGENGAFPPTRDVSVSAMLVSMRQKKYRSSFYS